MRVDLDRGTPTGSPASAGPGGAWLAIGLFGLANAMSFLDRNFLMLVLEPVRRAYGLSDTQAGLLVGPAFILIYSLAALPLGALADHVSRKWIIVAGLAAWSLCTAASGLANAFVLLAVARMGVGLGEATLTPAAVSIITDLTPRARLARAIALFLALGSIGASLAFILGAAILKALGAHPPPLPLLGELSNWRVTFLILGAPGLLLAAVIAVVVREPDRAATARQTEARASWATALRYMAEFPRATALIVLGFALVSAVSAAWAWVPAFYARHYGWEPTRVGPWLGLIQLVGGVAGTLSGGALADGLRRRGRQDANLVVALAVLSLAWPCYLAAPYAGSPGLTLAILAPAQFCAMACFGVATPALPLVTPAQMRSRVVALYLLAGNIFGFGLGPLFVPLLTDHVFHDPARLGDALAIVPGVLLPAALLILALCRRPFAARVDALAAPPRDAASESEPVAPPLVAKPGFSGAR